MSGGHSKAHPRDMATSQQKHARSAADVRGMYEPFGSVQMQARNCVEDLLGVDSSSSDGEEEGGPAVLDSKALADRLETIRDHMWYLRMFATLGDDYSFLNWVERMGRDPEYDVTFHTSFERQTIPLPLSKLSLKPSSSPSSRSQHVLSKSSTRRGRGRSKSISTNTPETTNLSPLRQGSDEYKQLMLDRRTSVNSSSSTGAAALKETSTWYVGEVIFGFQGLVVVLRSREGRDASQLERKLITTLRHILLFHGTDELNSEYRASIRDMDTVTISVRIQ